AEALGRLGARRAFVIHGAGGLDEVAVAGATEVAEWTGDAVQRYQVTPASFGLDEEDPAELAGGDAAAHAAGAPAVLGGRPGAPRAAVLMEAALALVASGVAPNFVYGIRNAACAIDDGAALATLERWATLSHG